jgi:hypothetical protein
MTRNRLFFPTNDVRRESPTGRLMSAREAAKRESIAFEVQDLIVPAETAQKLLQLFEAPNHGRPSPK